METAFFWFFLVWGQTKGWAISGPIQKLGPFKAKEACNSVRILLGEARDMVKSECYEAPIVIAK